MGTEVGEPAGPSTWTEARTARLASRRRTLKLLRRSPQQSVRFQMSTLWTFWRPPRSTCHQAWGSRPVWVTEPAAQLPLVLPSMALLAGPPQPGSLDWVAGLFWARFVSPEPAPTTSVAL